MDHSKIIASGRLPDCVFRFAIRQSLKKHLKKDRSDPDILQEKLNLFIKEINSQPIAIMEDDANEQHYEVPTDFFKKVLGSKLKYSSCLWKKRGKLSRPESDLDEAEERMLKLTVERAELASGQTILELGCGWGSLSLYMAEKYPGATIVAVSNSQTQKSFIDSQASERGFQNLKVITANVEDLEMEKQVFDRIVSVEMFEHMRNYPLFMKKLYPLLKEGGKMFIHIFSYRYTPYHFNRNDPEDWMARHFFSGGTMPCHELLPFCSGPFTLENAWIIPGDHYGNTLRAWLNNMDRQKTELMPLFKEVYASEDRTWWNNWRAFFIICEELFHYRKGTLWFISHYLFKKETSGC